MCMVLSYNLSKTIAHVVRIINPLFPSLFSGPTLACSEPQRPVASQLVDQFFRRLWHRGGAFELVDAFRCALLSPSKPEELTFEGSALDTLAARADDGSRRARPPLRLLGRCRKAWRVVLLAAGCSPQPAGCSLAAAVAPVQVRVAQSEERSWAPQGERRAIAHGGVRGTQRGKSSRK